MSVENAPLSPVAIVRDDFRATPNTSALMDFGRNSGTRSYLDRCATLACITKLVSYVQSAVNLHSDEDSSTEQLCRKVLCVRAKHCTFVERSPADKALEIVLNKLGLNNGVFNALPLSNVDEENWAQRVLLQGFSTRLQEALQSDDFGKAQRAWLKPVSRNLQACDIALDAIEAIKPPVYCVRHDVICHFDREDIVEEEWPQLLARMIFQLPSRLGLIAVLVRGERLLYENFRFHVVVFFCGGTGAQEQAVTTATQELFSRRGWTCIQPLGYRSAGEGKLMPGCKELRYSMRSMLSRDEFLRSRCSPALAFSFYDRDGGAVRFSAHSSEVAGER